MSTPRSSEPRIAALEAARSIRRSRGFSALPASERHALDANLLRLERALEGRPTYAGAGPASDPFAVPLETPRNLSGFGPVAGTRNAPPPAPPPSPPPQGGPAPRQPSGTEVLGERVRRTLDAVDFPAFVAGLIHGTFQSIVDATAQQVREYAKLVADLSKSVDDFTRDNVNANQARDQLADRYPQDLELLLPRPGEAGEPRVVPRKRAEGSSPRWLASYGLEGEELTAELTEGPLLEASKKAVGEDRLRTLATMVLMGINRIVVEDGQLKARLQFHAKAQERVKADVKAQTGGQQMDIAAQSAGLRTGVATMVSTVDVNTQSEVSLKADLVGEVSVRFRTETFDLQRFADSQAIQLISRHAMQRPAAQEAQPGAPRPGAAAPAPAPNPVPGGPAE